MKTLSILPVLIAITFGLKEASETTISAAPEKKIPAGNVVVKDKTGNKAFVPVDVNLYYHSGPGSPYALVINYSCKPGWVGCVSGNISYQFQSVYVSNSTSGSVSFPGVAIQPNVTQTLQLGSFTVKFYWPGYDIFCPVISIS